MRVPSPEARTFRNDPNNPELFDERCLLAAQCSLTYGIHSYLRRDLAFVSTESPEIILSSLQIPQSGGRQTWQTP